MEESDNKKPIKYKLVLKSVPFDAGEKINLIKKLRETFNIDLAVARNAIDNAPTALLYDLTEDYAMVLKSQIVAQGATFTIEPMEEGDYGKKFAPTEEDPSSYVLINSFKDYFKFLYDSCLAMFSGGTSPKYKYSTKFKIYIAIFWIFVVFIWVVAIFVPSP